MGNTIFKAKVGITISLQQKPSRKAIKAKLQVSKGKERALRSKVENMIQQAKQQIKQLQKKGFSDTPAITQLKKRGTTLTTKGKNYNQLQSTYFSLDKFLKAQTSNVEGALRVLNQTAEIIGIQDAVPGGLKEIAKEFFSIASLTQEYMASGKSGYAIGSTRVFEAIRRVTKENAARWNKAGDILDKTDLVITYLEEQIKKTQEYQMMDYASEKVENMFS